MKLRLLRTKEEHGSILAEEEEKRRRREKLALGLLAVAVYFHQVTELWAGLNNFVYNTVMMYDGTTS